MEIFGLWGGDDKPGGTWRGEKEVFEAHQWYELHASLLAVILQLSYAFNTFSSNVGRLLRRTSILHVLGDFVTSDCNDYGVMICHSKNIHPHNVHYYHCTPKSPVSRVYWMGANGTYSIECTTAPTSGGAHQRVKVIVAMYCTCGDRVISGESSWQKLPAYNSAGEAYQLSWTCNSSRNEYIKHDWNSWGEPERAPN